MIPQLVTVRHRGLKGRHIRLCVPVLPVALLLSPLLLVAVLAGLIACLIMRVNPLGALRGLGRVVWALPGTRFEIQEGESSFSVSVR